MESNPNKGVPRSEQPQFPETPVAFEIIGLKEALRMLNEGFDSDLETLDALQRFIDQPAPDPNDVDAYQEYSESIAFAQEIIDNLLPKTERSRDLAQQISLRIRELENQS